jgi:CubicO group peptidase (beta-lactamase class C family)
MRRVRFVLFFLSVLTIFAGCEKKKADAIFDLSYRNPIKQTRKEFADFLSRNQIPGGNIAISIDNKFVYSEAMGVASIDLKVPMTRDNKLRIGDVSELFTSMIYLKLVEEGVLNPDSSVQHYLPNYPETEFTLQLWHLPYHTSGIRVEDGKEHDMVALNLSLQKGLELFMHDKLVNSPGVYEEVSMFNANLLGAVIEKVTKKRFPQLLKEYITDTLHLTNTVVDNPILPIDGRADYFDQDMLGNMINAPFQDLRYKAPSCGILSNAEDLVKLGMAILDSEYLNKNFTNQLFKPCNLYGGFKSRMAHGWMLSADKNGRNVNIRFGGVAGGGAVILIYPEEKLVMAYAVNRTLGNEGLPVFKIANQFLQNP